MKNYQRILAITLITSITASAVGSTRAWAEISLETRSTTVPIERRVVTTQVDYQQQQTMNVLRDNSQDLTCKAYAGMDRQVLQAKHDQLQMKHVGNFVAKPAVSAVSGAVAGGLIFGPIGAVVGGIFGGIFSWFRGGDTEQKREVAQLRNSAEYDQETLQLNCMENELKKAQIYAGAIPGQMPASVSSSNEQKSVTSTTGGSSAPSQYRNTGENGSAGGAVVSSSFGGGSTAQSTTSESVSGSYGNWAPVEERSIAGCLR